MGPIALLGLAGLALLALSGGKKRTPAPPTEGDDVEPLTPSLTEVPEPTAEEAVHEPEVPSTSAPAEVEPSTATELAQQAPGQVVQEVVPPVITPEPAPAQAQAQTQEEEDDDAAVHAPEPPDAAPAEVEPSAATEQAQQAPGQVTQEVVADTSDIEAMRHGAALELATLARQLLAAHQGPRLGVRGAPSSEVKRLQLAMGMSAAQADGIYGPATRATAKALGANPPVRA